MEIQTLAGVFILAFFTEGIVEYLFAKKEVAQPILKYVALIIGITLAVAYNVDILGEVGMLSAVPIIGNVISGIVLGRGSNYANDFVQKLKK